MATQKRFIAKNGLDNNSNTIPNVADPVNSQDVVTKNYTSSNFLGASSSAYPTMYPTLNLDFANSKQLDSRITFTRNSIATYYDGQTSALAEQNLVTYSQAIGGTNWSNVNVTPNANTVVAPDGTTTASNLVDQATTAVHSSYQTLSITAGLPYTISCYVKANGFNYIGLLVNNGGTGIGQECAQVYNLSTGTVGGSYNLSPTTTTITPAPNGYYRITLTITFATTTYGFGICPQVSDTNPRLGTVGDGISGVAVWGAQVEQRSSATAYTPTTTAAITNYIPQLMTAPAGVPRLDYNPTTGQAFGLLIEESRTNLFTYSSDFSNAIWVKGGTTVTSAADTIIAPDGTLTGDTLTSTVTTHNIYQSVTVTASTTYTFSWYVKLSTITPKYSVWNQTTPGDIIAPSLYPTGTSVGNGWFRYSATFTTPVGCVAVRVYPLRDSGTAGDMFIWGAQLEAGAFPTSYIPTVASTVTRDADAASMTGTNFSSWYNQSEGTFFVKYIYGKKLASIRVCSVSDGTTSNYIDVIAASGTVPEVTYGAYLYGAINGNAGVFSTNSGSTLINTVDTMRTFAGAYKTNDFKSCNNGGYVGVDISSSVPVVDRLYFSNSTNSTGALLNGHIRKISYYPVALSASNLVALTT